MLYLAHVLVRGRLRLVIRSCAGFTSSGPIARGSWVLVHSAAGGVGSFLVQIAKIKGWKVAGVVGQTHKVQACRDLGADVIIDKQGMSSAQLWCVWVDSTHT